MAEFLSAFLIVFTIVSSIVGVCIYFFVRSIRKARRPIIERNQRAEELSSIYHGTIKHCEGLPFPKGIMMEAFYRENDILFKKDNQEITLKLNKIISMDIVSGSDLKNQAAGAAAGAFIFGGITGAALGALAASGSYLVITYKKDEETKTILLDTKEAALADCNLPVQKIVKDFMNTSQREVEQIEL